MSDILSSDNAFDRTWSKWLLKNIDLKTQNILTPSALCRSMLSRRKIKRLLNSARSKTLVVNNVEFLRILKELGANMHQVWYSSDLKEKIDAVKKMYPEVHRIEMDIRYWKEDKMFDIIVGNPPYTDGTTGRTNIWPDILKKCMSLTDTYVLMVIPKPCALGDSSENAGARKLLLDNGLQLFKFVDRNLFPTAKTGITYFICDRTAKDSTSLPIIYSETDETYIYDEEDAFFPNTMIRRIINKIAIKIGKQYYNKPINCYKPKGVSKKPKPDLCPSQCVNKVNPAGTILVGIDRSDLRIRDIWKVVTSYQNNSSKGWHLECVWPVDKGCDIIGGYRYIEARSQQESERIGAYLRTAFCNVIWYYTRTTRTMDGPQIRYIPNIGHQDDWTDKKLFDHFKLDKEEREFILSEFDKDVGVAVH